MPRRVVYTVRWLKALGEWQVANRNGDVVANTGTKEEAIYMARSEAKANEPSQVRLYNKNGRIATEWTYPRSSDPRARKG